MDIKTNRIRAPNFSQDEKLILVSLIKKYKLIIENMWTDAVSVRDKEEAWLKILDERMLKRLAKMQADLEAQNKSTDPSTSVELLRDVTNSELNNEMTHLHQIKEEQMDSNGEKIGAYNEKGFLNETIEYCTHQDFIFANVNNVVKTEDYKEEDYEEKDSMLSQSIEYPVNTKDTTIDNNCFVDTHNTRKNISTGRFIVDFSFMWSEIHRIFNDHARELNCQFKYWKLVNCRRCGFLTQFFFKCEMCHYEASIWSEPVETKTSDINTSAVTASVATGMRFSKLKQLFASMNITYEL